MNRPTAITVLTATLALSGVLAACGSGPGSAEFVQACMKGQGATEEMCECAEDEADSKYSADAYEAMVLDMQGKGYEARAIMEKMSEREQMATLQALGEIFGKCFVDKE